MIDIVPAESTTVDDMAMLASTDCEVASEGTRVRAAAECPRVIRNGGWTLTMTACLDGSEEEQTDES